MSVSAAFSLLHESVRRWVWEQHWTELREIQEGAIGPILEGRRDVILSAGTASGKTEAAFLPICSRLATGSLGSIHALYVGPLKALINDQFERLERLCEHLDIPVHRWHGDVSQSRKQGVLKEPGGILLITPESLEALFIRQGSKVGSLLAGLQHVVIDELHAFIGTERGRQLQSLLHRVELAVRRQVPRIGLSATLGDMSLAAGFLRPGRGSEVVCLVSADGSQELRLQIRGYLAGPPREQPPAASGSQEQQETAEDTQAMGEHLFRALRGSSNLIFANSRLNVELYADLLRRLCERHQVPNEFWPHHGNLSRELREEVEAALKARERPVNVVCTTTLEMGIDIGTVRSVAQVGGPPSVSSLRQRLGRSGRRGEPSILRLYIQEAPIEEGGSPATLLRARLVQTLAMVELLLRGWCEPPRSSAYHFSTLVQQLLSLIAQHGGVSASQAWSVLCGQGPFSNVGQALFARLLRALGSKRLLTQSSDGTLLLGEVGERLVAHYSFYAAFATPEEFRLVTGGRTLGTLPIDHPLTQGGYLIFGGQRWRIISVDLEHRVVDLSPAAGGRVPVFEPAATGWVHDVVREEMLELYCSQRVPAYLDSRAQDLLMEGRESFLRMRLRGSSRLLVGDRLYLFPWRGDRAVQTLLLQLQARGLAVEDEGVALAVGGTEEAAIEQHLRALAAAGPADGWALAAGVTNKEAEKYDGYLPDELLSLDFAARGLDSQGAWQAVCKLLEQATTAA
jgi:ATP-dependent helicase Lhr and Lhr-like helicase